VQVVGRARLELGDQMKIKVAGLARFGVDEQSSTANVGGQVEKSSEDVLEKPDAEPATLVVDIGPESGEQRNGLGIATGTMKETLRCCNGTDLGHAPGVVGDDPRALLLSHDEDTGRSRVCRLAGITLQPLSLFA
jgi:hypothetical protein